MKNGQLVNVGTNPLGSTAWNVQMGDWAPRFGFAFRPFANDKTVIRGGFGIFYDLGSGTDASVSGLFRGIPFRQTQTFTNTPTQLVATYTDPYPATSVAVGGYTPLRSGLRSEDSRRPAVEFRRRTRTKARPGLRSYLSRLEGHAPV